MKLLAGLMLSTVFVLAGCKPDAAVKRGAVLDQPTKKAPSTKHDTPTAEQQPPQH